MKTFIEDFKNTPYYKNLVLNNNVVLLYIGGSNCTNTATPDSDYDLIAITDDLKTFDASEYLYLMYKGKKVHWYYWSLSDFLNAKLSGLWTIGSIYFRNITDSLIIYKNPLYEKLIASLLEKKFELSKLAIYKLFDLYKFNISSFIKLKKSNLLESSKYLYHLCLAACYLTASSFDKNELIAIKNNGKLVLSERSKQAALDYLKLGIDYINKFPVDYRKELTKIYDGLQK